jgi:hypothetical protein
MLKPYSPDSYRDPTSWVELRQLLVTARSELGRSGFVPPFVSTHAIRKSSAEERRRLLESSYQPHEQAVAQAVLTRFDTGSWPLLNPVRAHYASIILRYASMFVAHACFQMETGQYSTLFPFPDLPVNDVALYLCTLWWHSVGWLDYSRDFASRIEPLA